MLTNSGADQAVNEKITNSFRDKSHPEIYRVPSNLDKLEPDRVPPVVHGYFMLPAVWVGEEPSGGGINLREASFTEVVVEKTLRSGIRARALRDGTFLFDFTYCPMAPVTVIPGFSFPNPPKPRTVPPANTAAYWKAEERAILRSRILNVHQLLLTDAERIVQGRSAGKGYPVSPWNGIQSIDIDQISKNREIPALLRDVAGRVINGHYQVEQPEMFQRRVLSAGTVEHSFDLLDQVVERQDEALIIILEESFKIGWHDQEGRFGEALISGWTVCEQIISQMWSRLVKDLGITGARKDKLIGVEYTISQKIEFLNLSDKIDKDLYLLLEAGRKARNAWIHKLNHPGREVISSLTEAVQTLLRMSYGIDTSLTNIRWSGTPTYPIWFLRERDRFPYEDK